MATKYCPPTVELGGQSSGGGIFFFYISAATCDVARSEAAHASLALSGTQVLFLALPPLSAIHFVRLQHELKQIFSLTKPCVLLPSTSLPQHSLSHRPQLWHCVAAAQDTFPAYQSSVVTLCSLCMPLLTCRLSWNCLCYFAAITQSPRGFLSAVFSCRPPLHVPLLLSLTHNQLCVLPPFFCLIVHPFICWWRAETCCRRVEVLLFCLF